MKGKETNFTDVLEDKSPSRRSATLPLARTTSDPFDDAAHARWDRDLLEFDDIQLGPVLLCAIVGQCPELNQRYANFREAIRLYNANEPLREEMEKAWKEKSFRSVRQLVILQSPPKSSQSSGDVASLKASAKRLLDLCEDKMLRFASGEPTIDMWTSTIELQTRLKIPELRPGVPDMLIHELGEWSNAGGVMEQSVSNLFHEGRHTFLFNASGSGKTRHVLEGLCQNWGFYFTCAKDMFSYQGSYDVPDAIALLSDLPTWYEEGTLPSDNLTVDRNRAKAELAFLRVWLARLLIFHFFIKSLPSTTPPADSRRLWVLAQLFPAHIFEGDIFRSMAKRLFHANIHVLKSMIDETHADIKKLLPSIGPIFAVFDEAQQAVSQDRTTFMSDDYAKPSPVLGEIIAVFENIGHDVTMIVSGTCSFTDVRRNSSRFPIGEPRGWRLFTSTGAFDNQRAQDRYIMRYLWPHLNDKEELISSHKLMLDRAWLWLRGRYRFTATLVQLLLQHGTGSANLLFDAYFEQVTHYHLTDMSEHGDLEGPLTYGVLTWIKGVSPIHAGVLEREKYASVKVAVFQHLLKSLFRSETVVERSDRELFVELGLAHFCKGSEPDPPEVRMDEPLALMFVSSLLDCYVRDPKESLDIPVSLELLAFYFLVVFDGTMPLDAIINFETKKPSWARKPAQVRAAYTQNADKKIKTCLVTPNRGPSPMFGFCAQSEEETIGWLKNSDRVPFCFPNDGFGPDILFLIEVGGRLIWVATQAKILQRTKQAGGDGNTDSHEPNLVPSILKTFCLTATSRRSPDRKVKQGASDSILRLILSPTGRKLSEERLSEYPYPLAFVDMTRLVETMRGKGRSSYYDLDLS